MKYLRSAHLFIICCIHHIVSVKAKSNNLTSFVIGENNSNEKYKNHNMDGWTPIKPTLEYLKLNQRKNCVSIGFYNADCRQLSEKSEKTKNRTRYKAIVDLFQRDYHSPYGNYVAEILPKLPNHYKNPLPRYRQNNRREFRRFATNTKRNIELPRFIDEYPTKSRSFAESTSRYWKSHQYPMFEPIPGQILYPPSVPQFKSNPLNEIGKFYSLKDDDIAYTRSGNVNIKTFQSTIFPFFEHESVTKRSTTKIQNARRKFDTTSPVYSMVIEPTTIKASSTTSGIKPSTKATTIGPPIQYVYSVAMNHSKKENVLNDFEKELPRKVVIESPPKNSLDNDHMNGMISTKLSNRFLEYTTTAYSNYVTIKPHLDRPDKRDATESIVKNANEIPKNRVKIIPLLHSAEDQSSVENTLTSSLNSTDRNRTYMANSAGFKNLLAGKSTKKTTLKPLIYTLISLLLDTDNRSSSHQLSKPGQYYYVDHLSSTIINDYVGKTQRTAQPAEAVQSSITIKHQPPLPNKSNNQNTTNSRWTQPHELYAINNNNDGINDRDQKIKDNNLDIVITTDGPTTNRNQIYENKNYSGINDGDEWMDGNVDGNSRSFNGYGRVNVEWIMVAKR